MGFRMTSMIERMKARRVVSTFLILTTLVLGILIGTTIQKGVKGKEASASSADAAPLSVPAPQQLSSAFSQIAKQMEPAVVNINTESTIKANPQGRRRRGAPRDDQDPFQDFFDRFFGGQGEGQFGPPEGARERSLGSGVLVDSKGYIVTNQHVVDRADRIRVKLMDDPPGVQHDAKVVGTDRETDLAVIKIDVTKPLPYAKMGNSDAMNVGDWVLAIGSPFGLEESVTAGIISSKKRSIDNRRQFQNFLQTDAAINPGNSGGPLVNMAGEVIGLNTAIFTQSAGYQGVGFAMPSNTIVSVYNQLIGPEHKVSRGSIGISFNGEANPALARVYGVKGGGVTISSVTSGGPAEQAGLKVGDTITSVDGKPVSNGDSLVDEISAHKPGSKVKIGYVREGKQAEASVTVADRAKLFAERLGEEENNSPESQPADTKLGINVRNLTPEMAERFNIPQKGVVVQDVKPNSFGDDIGLQRGDIIIEINRKPVNSDDDFRKIQSQLKGGDDVAMLVRQGGRGDTIFYSGTLQ